MQPKICKFSENRLDNTALSYYNYNIYKKKGTSDNAIFPA